MPFLGKKKQKNTGMFDENIVFYFSQCVFYALWRVQGKEMHIRYETLGKEK